MNELEWMQKWKGQSNDVFKKVLSLSTIITISLM